MTSQPSAVIIDEEAVFMADTIEQIWNQNLESI